MTPAEFISKWGDATLRERQGAHGQRYCFERRATKAGGGDGWADVWRRGCFILNTKQSRADCRADQPALPFILAGAPRPDAMARADTGILA